MWDTDAEDIYFSASELRIIWDLRWYTFYGSVLYQSKDSCMYHKQSMVVICTSNLTSSTFLLHVKVETDEQYLSKVSDVMHSLFGTHGATLLPLFDELLPTYASMLVSQEANSCYINPVFNI